jgi:hypothetical protein
MHIDKYRTSKRENKTNAHCYCSVVSWQPHRSGYCKKLEREQYEASLAEPVIFEPV